MNIKFIICNIKFIVYQAQGECSARWEEARDGSCTATVSFTHEAKLQEVANQLGGGVRGLFSVAVVADAPAVTPAPMVAAVGSWSTPKKTGSMCGVLHSK